MGGGAGICGRTDSTKKLRVGGMRLPFFVFEIHAVIGEGMGVVRSLGGGLGLWKGHFCRDGREKETWFGRRKEKCNGKFLKFSEVGCT